MPAKRFAPFALTLFLLLPPTLATAQADTPVIRNHADLQQVLDQNQAPLMLVNFWATWCGPCLLELPELVRLRENYDEQSLHILGVSFDLSPRTLDDFLEHNPLNYPTVWADPQLMIDMGIQAIPKTLLLDRNGLVLVDHDGRAEYEELDRAIKTALHSLTQEDVEK